MNSRKRFAVLGFLLFMLARAGAQEWDLAADLRREREELAASCVGFNPTDLAYCGKVIFAGTPLRVAVDSLPPGNSIAFGLAYHKEHNTSIWRTAIDGLGEGSMNGSWRAGFYGTAVLSGKQKIVVTDDDQNAKAKPLVVDPRRPEFHVLAEAISLNELAFYGEGNDTAQSSRAFYGMSHRYFGGNGEWPLPLGFSVLGEIGGRWFDLRARHGNSSPSIEQAYTEFEAPGIGRNESYFQTGEGLRFDRSLKALFRFTYLAQLQQFHASDSFYSFRRFTLSGNHELSLYRTKTEASGNKTRNKVGAVSVGGSMVQSIAPAGKVVPFYLQPTLGGSDINHEHKLASYPDYRFRAPNYWLARASLDHDIYGPVGLLAWADVGKVAIARDDLNAEHLRHSFGIGVTLKAGNYPFVSLSFAWGGREGTRVFTDIRGIGQAKGPSLY